MTSNLTEVFVHPQALCESPHIGRGTRIWAFSHVLPGARIGADCNICESVFIENDVVVGDRVTIKNGVQLWDGVTLEDDVFVGPNATFSNDKFPRSKQRPAEFIKTTVRRGASIGANATLLPGIEIGAAAMVGAGSVVTQSVPSHAVVVGNPARIVSTLNQNEGGTQRTTKIVTDIAAATSLPGGCEHWVIPAEVLGRGIEALQTLGLGLPFGPKHIMVVRHDAAEASFKDQYSGRVRYLFALEGPVSLTISDDQFQQEVLLEPPGPGLRVPANVRILGCRLTPSSTLIVLDSPTVGRN